MAKSSDAAAAVSDIWARQHIIDFAPDEASIPAAQKVLKKGGFGTVEPTADGKGWWVVCQGITDIYQVSVRVDDGVFACDCTCPSPKYPCKHALALLLYLSEHPEARAEPEAPKYAPSDFEALVRSVFQNADDDTPRLVFADFLEENDEPDRAALIRVQCELAREKPRSLRTKELERQARGLVAKLTTAVVDPLPEGMTAEFHRGFLKLRTELYTLPEVGAMPGRFTKLFRDGWVETVQVDGYFFDILEEDHATLFGLAAELDFSAHPMPEDSLLAIAARSAEMQGNGRLRRVKVAKSNQKVFNQLLAAREGEVTNADSGGREERQHHSLTPQTLDLLIRSGRLRTTRRVWLEGRVGDQGAEQLASAPFDRLESLWLVRWGLGDSGLATLANAPGLATLTSFGVTESPLTGGAVAALAQGTSLTRLQTLDLTNIELDDTAVAELAKATRFRDLLLLDLAGNPLTPKGAAEVLRSANFPSLRTLILSNRPIAPGDLLPILLTARERPELSVRVGSLALTRRVAAGRVRLFLTDSDTIPEPVLMGLGRCSEAKDLVGLSAFRPTLTPRGFEALAQGMSPESLRELELRDARFGNAGAEALVAAFKDYRLETLRLPLCRIQATGIAALANSPMMASLKLLDLSGNTIGKGGAEALAESPQFDKLERLELTDWKVGLADRKVLRDRFGKRLAL